MYPFQISLLNVPLDLKIGGLKYESKCVHIQIPQLSPIFKNFHHFFPGGPQPPQQPPQQNQEPQNQRPPASNADVLAELISFD